ncbi:MAG TPA: hypothetical protein VHV77_08130 [Pirellulales bacterium]|jgi:hypothetical protein|nr:hypothetical protein [Pirellulales bacterium]
MKRSRTALALFLGVFGGLLSAVELTGPVTIASESSGKRGSQASCPFDGGGCEYTRSRGYCEFAYDTSPKSAADEARQGYWDIDEEWYHDSDRWEAVEVRKAPKRSAPTKVAPKKVEKPTWYEHPGDVEASQNDCPDEIEAAPVKVVSTRAASAKAKPHLHDGAFFCPAVCPLPKAELWLSGPRVSAGQYAVADSLGPDVCDLSFLSPTQRIVWQGTPPIVLGLDAATSLAKHLAGGYVDAASATADRLSVAAHNTVIAAKARLVQRRSGRTTHRSTVNKRSR